MYTSVNFEADARAVPFKDSRPDTLAFMLSTLSTKAWLELVKGYAIIVPTRKLRKWVPCFEL
jgi:hypothetical protein